MHDETFTPRDQALLLVHQIWSRLNLFVIGGPARVPEGLYKLTVASTPLYMIVAI